MSYFDWLATFFGLPLLIFALIDYHIFLDHKKIIYKVWLGSFFFGIPWDLLAINNKVWTFPKKLSGISFLGLPLEEYMWAMMFASIVVYLTIFLLKQSKNDRKHL